MPLTPPSATGWSTGGNHHGAVRRQGIPLDTGLDRPPKHDPLAFLQGGGVMGALIRDHDWSRSTLGPPAGWPPALKSAISMVLKSGTAMHIAWGDGLLQFYNDAYVPVLTGGKHPAALGRGVRESFPEIWDFISPLFERVLHDGEAIAMENAGLLMYRDGVLKESFFSFSYSPLRSPAGEVCGVVSVCWETTGEVPVKRRGKGLHLLTEQLAAAASLEEVRQAVRWHVGENRGDLPFLLWYERDEASNAFRLVKRCGIAPDAPLVGELEENEGGQEGTPVLDPASPVARLVSLREPATPWLVDPPHAMAVERIAVEPLCYVDYSTPDAYLVFGLGAQRPVDAASRNFRESVCRGIERAVRRINVVELDRRERLRQFDAVTRVVPSMVWMTDAQGACTFLSRRWLEFSGQTLADSLGRGWMAGLHPGDRAAVADELGRSLESRGPLHTLFRYRRADGQYRWLLGQGLPRYGESGTFLGIVGSSLDITERKALEDELLVLASEDPLTGLPNRRFFRERLVQVCRDATAGDGAAALVFLDLDHFNTVNDSLTHEAGDLVLREVAARLVSVVGEAGTVSRLGGDEFAIVLAGCAPAEATAIAERIAAVVARPIFVEATEVFLTASVGIAMAPADATGADELLSCADLAMHEVKRRGRNGVARYLPHLRAAAASLLSLRGRMARGLERGEYFVAFQPIASVEARRIVAAEALLRWQPPEGDAIGPTVFIPIAEETGLIVPLGEHMMSLAFAQAAAWKRQGHPMMISVNLSTRQLREPDICRRIGALAAEHGVTPGMVQLEITESVLMEHQEHSGRQLLALKDMGFRIALDDFGTGYSSLAYLKSFPIDAIKIDSSFIRGLVDNPRDAAIVRTIINMSRDLGISTVAEGVETAAELNMIAALRCDFYQGFLLGRPGPADLLPG